MNRKEFLIISFTVFLTVLAWVLADIFHAKKTKNILPGTFVNESLTIKFDPELFDKLREKLVYE